MRIFLSIATIALTLLAFSSCKKCYNCSYTENGEMLGDTGVCGSGKSIDDHITQLENNNWVCEKD